MTDTANPSPAPELQGRCHCGAVRLRVAPGYFGVVACHCGDCQRLHGNFFAMVAADPAAVQWEGDDAVVRYTSSPSVQRSFCRHCGSRIGKHAEGNPRVLLSVGLFGPRTGLVLRKNVWAQGKPDWYGLPPESAPAA